MLTKVLGPTQVVTLSGTAQTVTVTNADGTVPQKIRVATNSSPIYIDFYTTASATTSAIVPANWSEHFKLVSPSTSTVSVIGSGTVSITSVA